MPELSRALTVSSKAEIADLFKRSRVRYRHNGLVIRLAPRAGDYGRLLMVIPRKSGKAVLRNKARRRIKSIFYEQKLFELPFDWIVFVYKEAILLPFAQLRDIMVNLAQTELQKSGHSIP